MEVEKFKPGDWVRFRTASDRPYVVVSVNGDFIDVRERDGNITFGTHATLLKFFLGSFH